MSISFLFRFIKVVSDILGFVCIAWTFIATRLNLFELSSNFKNCTCNGCVVLIWDSIPCVPKRMNQMVPEVQIFYL